MVKPFFIVVFWMLGAFLAQAEPIWTPVNAGLPSLNAESIAVDGAGRVYVVLWHSSQPNTVMRSDDGGMSWSDITSGTALREINSVAAAGDGTVYLSGMVLTNQQEHYGMILRSHDHGEHWTETGNGLDLVQAQIRPMTVDSKNRPLVAFVGSRSNGLYRFDFEQDRWIRLDLLVSEMGTITAGSDDQIVVFNWNLGGSFATLSNDDGATFRNLRYSPTPPPGPWFAAELDAAGFVYLEAGLGQSGPVPGLFRTSDLGDTWTDLTANLPFSQTIASFLYARPAPFGDLFVGLDGDPVDQSDTRIYRSGDHGFRWTDVSAGLGSHAVRQLATAPDGTIFAATDGGVYRSAASVPVELAAFTIE